ncbi:MAG: hypothetical protein KAH57_00005, partial [Thermoplasmata archaeon]|nr:hypothetical protein [Thermoplasmata archaeon]
IRSESVGSESVRSDGFVAREKGIDAEKETDLEMTLRFSILKKGGSKRAKPKKKGFRIVAMEGSDDGAVDADWEDGNDEPLEDADEVGWVEDTQDENGGHTRVILEEEE